MSRGVERPRPWWPLDNTFLTRGSIEALADRAPGFGPLAIVALVCEANAAIGGGKRSGFDVLDWKYSYLARRIRCDETTARAIVHRAATVGLVEVVSENEDDFTLRLMRWREWHPRDPLAAERKRQQRTRDAHS